MAAWGNGPRHRSWASNSNIFGLSCLVVLIIYTAMWFASPTHDVPVEIKALVGIAGGAWFQGITTDKRKRDDDVRNTANRAEHKADDALNQSASSMERETEWSKHRDHTLGGDH